MVHGEAEVAKCEEASAALFREEIAGLSEEMLLAVTEDAPTTDRAPGRAARRQPDAGRPARAHRPGQVEGRGPAHHRPGGAYVNNVRQSDAARALGPADLLHDRYVVLRKGPRDVHIVRAT